MSSTCATRIKGTTPLTGDALLRLTITLVALLCAVPPADAREGPLGCAYRIGSHEPGAVAQCQVADRSFLVVAGHGQTAFCDPEVPNVIVVVGNENHVYC